MSRNRQLLEAAASAFDDLRSPFETEWLVEHEVTLDECGDLSENIAVAIRTFLNLPPNQLAESILNLIVKENTDPITHAVEVADDLYKES